MLSRSRTYFCLFFAMFLSFPLSSNVVKFLDEAVILLMLAFAVVDSIASGNFRRYKGLWICTAVMMGYVVYSIAIHSNAVSSILSDGLIQMKPFISFFVAYGAARNFTPRMKSTLKSVSVVWAIIMVCLLINPRMASAVLGHVFYAGCTCMLCVCVYLLCSVREDGSVSTNDKFVVLAMLAGGLLCTRSKYYGEVVLMLYFLFLYRPGVMKNVKPMQIVIFCLVIAVALLVTWKKISYYFLTGNSASFDRTTLHTFARPVLYATAALILLKYPWFGSGLASYATYASMEPYSKTYAEFGIDQVWGLSREFPDFICDVFYAELAQFGFVGVVLFIAFFVFIWKRLRMALHDRGRLTFGIGASLVAFVLIEAVASTMPIQGGGEFAMMILGVICAEYRTMTKAEQKELLQSPYPQMGEAVAIVK